MRKMSELNYPASSPAQNSTSETNRDDTTAGTIFTKDVEGDCEKSEVGDSFISPTSDCYCPSVDKNEVIGGKHRLCGGHVILVERKKRVKE